MKKKTILVEVNTMKKNNVGLKPKQMKRKGNILQDVTNELSRGNPLASPLMIRSLIDQQDKENVDEIVKNSKKIGERNMMTPDEAVDVISVGNQTWNQLRHMSRGVRNTGGKRLFPSEGKMRAAKKEKLPYFLGS